MIFLFNWMIFRFHVHFPGCNPSHSLLLKVPWTFEIDASFVCQLSSEESSSFFSFFLLLLCHCRCRCPCGCDCCGGDWARTRRLLLVLLLLRVGTDPGSSGAGWPRWTWNDGARSRRSSAAWIRCFKRRRSGVSTCFLGRMICMGSMGRTVYFSWHENQPFMYTSWKLDGTTPMYWFIMAPY